MQFINIVVHSVENMNFRVHLQYEFTQLGLDQYLEVRSDRRHPAVASHNTINTALVKAFKTTTTKKQLYSHRSHQTEFLLSDRGFVESL